MHQSQRYGDRPTPTSVSTIRVHLPAAIWLMPDYHAGRKGKRCLEAQRGVLREGTTIAILRDGPSGQAIEVALPVDRRSLTRRLQRSRIGHKFALDSDQASIG